MKLIAKAPTPAHIISVRLIRFHPVFSAHTVISPDSEGKFAEGKFQRSSVTYNLTTGPTGGIKPASLTYWRN